MYFTTGVSLLIVSLFQMGYVHTSYEIITKSSNAFSLDIYQALKNNSDNLVVSPLSMQIVLAMMYQGANGKTAEEIAKVIHQQGENDDVLEGYKELMTGLQDNNLQLATKIFIATQISVHMEYQSLLTKYFLSEVQYENFKMNLSEAVSDINEWVKEKTNNTIQELFEENELESDTLLVLANAIHFKDEWKHKFLSTSTFDAPFYVKQGEVVDVKMMSTTNFDFRYVKSINLGAALLELPYKTEDYKLMLILPDEIDGLNKVESQLEKFDFLEEFKNSNMTRMDLRLPRLKIENKIDMIPILRQLGINSAFGAADFSKLTDAGIQISKTIQRAIIEVNEEGTEAAAVTGGGIIPFNKPPRHVYFHCDHPFIYILLKGNTILFFGKFAKPAIVN